jgi:hypothetical protein
VSLGAGSAGWAGGTKPPTGGVKILPSPPLAGFEDFTVVGIRPPTGGGCEFSSVQTCIINLMTVKFTCLEIVRLNLRMTMADYPPRLKLRIGTLFSGRVLI